MNLYEELSRQGRQELLHGVAVAIGPVGETRDEGWSTVRCHYVDQHTNPLVTAVYLVSNGRLIRYEYNNETGETLTVCVPMSRLTRVSHAASTTNTQVVIELDADRITLSGVSQENPAATDGPPQRWSTLNMFRSGWVIEAAEQTARNRLNAFAARLRAQI